MSKLQKNEDVDQSDDINFVFNTENEKKKQL